MYEALPIICGANDGNLFCDLYCGNELYTIALNENGSVCLHICVVYEKKECLLYVFGTKAREEEPVGVLMTFADR